MTVEEVKALGWTFDWSGGPEVGEGFDCVLRDEKGDFVDCFGGDYPLDSDGAEEVERKLAELNKAREMTMEERNAAIEMVFLAELRTHPERTVLYVTPNGTMTTWLGTVVDTRPRFNFWTKLSGLAIWGKRRYVVVNVFGCLYGGWEYETMTSGNMVRLKRLKRAEA